ncbi:amidohydrolase family protein (plasmid) [Sinorhizobium terangae]|nr:amidohydrolase family protein [Sinorhizobium terangae]WFU50742.1 amidohydrolase family protein [Sinorhizobium terangae]
MLLPGFVNIHCHSDEEPLSKGIFDDMGTAALWGQAMYEYSTLIEISEEAREASLTIMLGDLIRSGVTTLVDIAGPHEAWLPTLERRRPRLCRAGLVVCHLIRVFLSLCSLDMMPLWVGMRTKTKWSPGPGGQSSGCRAH